MDLPPPYDECVLFATENHRNLSQSYVEPPAMQMSNAAQLPTTNAQNNQFEQLEQPQMCIVGSQFQPLPAQQHPTAVHVNHGYQPSFVVRQNVVKSYVKHQVFACFVMWLFNWLFGLIAWGLALTAENLKIDCPEEAQRYGKASVILSLSGVIVTLIIIIIVVSLH